MLSVLLGFSKYYIDSLSENVRRGNRTKAERGWRPSGLPLGYRYESEGGTVVIDPEHAAFLRRLFALALTGAYTVTGLQRIATDEWGYRLPSDRRYKGRVLARATLYRMLRNRFYTGEFTWNGIRYEGKHEPLISIEDWKRMRALIGRSHRERPQVRSFAYTGLIRCGGCGLMVTAEHHEKPSGKTYDYYRCTRRNTGDICREPAIPAGALDAEFARMLQHIEIDRSIAQFLDHLTTKNLVAQNAGRQSAIERLERGTNRWRFFPALCDFG